MTAVATVDCEATVDLDELAAALKFVSGAAPRSAPMPILMHVLLRMEDGALTITGTDLDRWARIQIDAEVEGSGSVCAPSRELGAVIAGLSGPVQLALSGTTLRVADLRGRFTLLGQHGNDFPLYPTAVEGGEGTVPRSFLKEAVSVIAPMVSQDGGMDTFACVLWESGGGKTRAVATNRHILGSLTIQGEHGPASVLIPQAALALAANLPGSDDIAVTGDARHLTFTAERASATVRLVDGRYPNWEQLLPRDLTNTLVVERAALVALTKRALALAHSDTHRVEFTIGETWLAAKSARQDRGEASDAIPVWSYEGVEMLYAMNGNYVLRVLAGIPHERVRIRIGKPTLASLWGPDEDETDRVFLIMPLRPIA